MGSIWWEWYVVGFFGGWLILAVDEVVVSCTFDAGIVGALEHKQLPTGVLAAVASVHPYYYKQPTHTTHSMPCPLSSIIH